MQRAAEQRAFGTVSQGRSFHRAITGLLLLGCCSCGVKRVSKVVIPPSCAHIKVTDFTKPCETQPDGSLICDRVHVSVSCTAVMK